MFSTKKFKIPQVKDFMSRVVPWEGDGFINLEYQVKNPQREKPVWTRKSVTQIDDFLALAEQKSKEETVTNVYFCLSRQKNFMRRLKNTATHLKAIWLDIDVKSPPKGYATIEEAIDALFDFIAHYDLPPPSAIVVSGGGLHVYWFSNRPLPVAEWQSYANGLKAAALQWGLKCDAMVTTDAARVLRVPGTRNFKTDPPKRVQIYHLQDKDIDFAADLTMLLGLSPPLKGNGAGADPLLKIAPAFNHLDPRQGLGQGIKPLPPLPSSQFWTSAAGCVKRMRQEERHTTSRNGT
jgi:hypothetical protein